MKIYLADFFGTFLLVLCGTGAIIFHEMVYPIGNFGIALAFGGIVTAMIYAFGKVSGAHINPAVTVGFLALANIERRASLCYLVAQILGGIAASVLLRLLFPANELLGTTLPAAHWEFAFLLEFFLTFLLMIVILSFGQNEKLKKYTAVAVGATVGLEAFFAGPYTGASMNPARSIAPAIVSGHTEHLWLYIVATMLGAYVAARSWYLFNSKKS